MPLILRFIVGAVCGYLALVITWLHMDCFGSVEQYPKYRFKVLLRNQYLFFISSLLGAVLLAFISLTFVLKPLDAYPWLMWVVIFTTVAGALTGAWLAKFLQRKSGFQPMPKLTIVFLLALGGSMLTSACGSGAPERQPIAAVDSTVQAQLAQDYPTVAPGKSYGIGVVLESNGSLLNDRGVGMCEYRATIIYGDQSSATDYVRSKRCNYQPGDSIVVLVLPTHDNGVRDGVAITDALSLK